MSGTRDSHEVVYEDDGTRVETSEQTQTVFGWFGEYTDTWRHQIKDGPNGYSEQSTYSRKPVKE